MCFSDRVIRFCEDENYYRTGPVSEKEFSQVCHKLDGVFFTSDMTLERMTEAINCTVYARVREGKPAE